MFTRPFEELVQFVTFILFVKTPVIITLESIIFEFQAGKFANRC